MSSSDGSSSSSISSVTAGGGAPIVGDHMKSGHGLPSTSQLFKLSNERFPLESPAGAYLDAPELAYDTYGSLNESGTNCIIVGHSLTSNSCIHEWWPQLLGSGASFALDTSRYFIVCANYMCSVYGSSSPLSLDAATGKPYGRTFPVTSIRDNVRLQHRLLTALGVKRIAIAVGGSLGGMLALEWAATYPELVDSVALISTCAQHSAWAIGWGEVGRATIAADARWKGGAYIDTGGPPPMDGMGAARQLAMLSYRSPHSYTEKFGRAKARQPAPHSSSAPAAAAAAATASSSASTPSLAPLSSPSSSSTASSSSSSPESTHTNSAAATANGSEGSAGSAAAPHLPLFSGLPAAEFSVESYLRHQDEKFRARFDPLCYFRLLQTLDTHDVGRGHAATATSTEPTAHEPHIQVLQSIKKPALIVGTDSDLLYPLALQYELAKALASSRLEILASPHGHDSFLIEIEYLNKVMIDWRNSFDTSASPSLVNTAK